MQSTDPVSIPTDLLTKRQRRALESSQPDPGHYCRVSRLMAACEGYQRLQTTIDNWKKVRVIPYIQIGRVIRFDLAAVKLALEKHYTVK